MGSSILENEFAAGDGVTGENSALEGIVESLFRSELAQGLKALINGSVPSERQECKQREYCHQ